MTRRTLGTSDLSVFPICLGGNVFGWTADTKASEAILDGYVAAGGNFVDTADAYSRWVPGHQGGESETVIGNWMAARGNRAQFIVATKVAKLDTRPGLAPDNVRAAADDSLRRLKSDYIDLYYAHEDDMNVPVADVAGVFDELVRAGKVRAVGLSNFTPERVREFVRVATENALALPVAVQPHYNLVHRAEFESGMAQACVDLSLGVAPYFALAAGLLTGKYAGPQDLEGVARSHAASQYLSDQTWAVVAAVREIAQAHAVAPATVALAWLRDRPAVTAPIASASKLEQLSAIVAAASFTLPETEQARLADLSAGL